MKKFFRDYWFLVIVLVISMIALIIQFKECNKVGGVLVRSLFGVECIII